MRCKPLFILFVLMLSTVLVKAGDSVIVRKDARLDVLNLKQKQANQRSAMMTADGLYKGFRIQVVSTTKRDDANRVRADLMSKFPDQKTYLVFQSPNYKVRIGNFIKRDEAEKFKAQLNKIFTNGVYIVEEGVEYTLKDDEDIIPQ